LAYVVDGFGDHMKIIVDTRERNPWKFSKAEWPFGYERLALKTGDYSLNGLHDIFTIDKKAKVTELARNLSESRFERELERMRGMKHSYIVCDFPLSDLEQFPYIDSVPHFLRKKIRAKGPYLVSILERLKAEYPTEWIFTEVGGAREATLTIIKDMAFRYANVK